MDEFSRMNRASQSRRSRKRTALTAKEVLLTIFVLILLGSVAFVDRVWTDDELRSISSER